MKPVNLLPSSSAAAVATPSGGKPNLGMIGGAALGVVCIIGVAGYFAMARVDSVKSETTSFKNQADDASTKTQAVRSEIQSIGQPLIDSDKDLAKGAEAVLVSAYTERYDFVLLARELRGIMPNADGWYEKVEAASVAGTGQLTGKSVKIVGFAVSEKLAASFNERAEATRSLKDATTNTVKSVVLRDVKSKRVGTYWRFELEADLVDLVAPSAGGSAGSTPGGITVAGGGPETFQLSINPNPPAKGKKDGSKAVKPVEPAKPKNPFDIAAAAAGGAS